ncbi:long-chain fatty acid--CoA ligase [Terasakiispira papahanaumokuakeensis]|uniref:Long-chain fatty acid--CoA ligase n=1 Tax=Terasakiispira papahanaumokuakeensis TaxID=197479 RepID=A0A1E2VBW2_9GAMM|nr:fatty acid--CoA ligase [Terasakiispira papahanaumokuakeensis]ODC04498.1 long-chain fatty acid--CoA ligase [Terasakiispira papahanaumokuakeensis]
MAQTLSPRLINPTPSAHNPPLLIKDLLTSGVRMAGENPIVYRDLCQHSYATFQQRVHQLAHMLSQQGVKAGDVVAVLDWDSHRYLECFFAIPMLGAILHTVNVRLSPEQIHYTMAHAEDQYLLVHDDFLPLISQLIGRLPDIKSVILCTDQGFCTDPMISRNSDSAFSPPQALAHVWRGEYETLLSEQSTHYEFAEFDENAIATLFYTTGTTGNPKGVCFSHRQLVLHTLTEASTLQQKGMEMLDRDKVYMPITPMFHVHAWGIPYTATLLGCKQVYPGRYEPETLVELLVTEQVDFSHCVPTLLNMVLEHPRVSGDGETVDLSNWKVLIGGSALPQGLARKAHSLGIDVRSAYGMSETCPLLTAAILPAHIEQATFEEQLPWRCRTGLAVPLVNLEILDVDGQPLPHDDESIGEVCVRAPWLTQTYFKEEARSEALWEGGWLHTGDVGTLDETGVLQVRDRMKDVIKTGGEWVSSLELENLISLHPGVAEVAVIGIPDPQWGERPVALVMAAEAQSPVSASSLRQHLKQFVDEGRLTKWALPNQYQIVTEIPKTSVGKLDKKRIRALINESGLNEENFLSSR